MDDNKTFPTWLDHEKFAPKGQIFQSGDETKKLGKGWVDTPAKFPKPSRLIAVLDGTVKPWCKKWQWTTVVGGCVAGTIEIIVKMYKALHRCSAPL